MLSQLFVLFSFFALVLVAVYWVNRAVILFDELIADGHSATVFLEFTALSLPKVIGMVLPMAAFAAAVYVTNRLSGDSELTVMQATGYSPWRLARPVFIFGLFVAVMMNILTHVLIPASLEQLKEREREIAGSVSAKLLREGVFLHPADDVTFYIRDISPEGELRDVFMSDERDPLRHITYTAERAYLLRDEAGPKLIMVDGMAQILTPKTGQLSTTNFTQLSRDISGLIAQGGGSPRKLRYIPTWELLWSTDAIEDEVREDKGEILIEAHKRLTAPLLGLVAALIGQAALLVGGFSRFGVTKQVVLAVFLIVVVQLIEGATTDPVRSSPELWPLSYSHIMIGLLIWAALLWRAGHPMAFVRRKQRGATPETEVTA
ncbi:LPS export ABC transporter permease LptF [Primorskyibacter aestuariivivens]|uniref:LPS export ABC transporter permease LptF n=1 Tax=Primorskyibacter aestuariivivens TaxID=1888912 RepID=UPI00230124C8|nr:LPS export ABC transporter permease LptF [Primorskyibacter aestuariivivens]MDA7430579.1 LPS export ABC transporter permease LptF [Primorskyibacter aestuariivivens]